MNRDASIAADRRVTVDDGTRIRTRLDPRSSPEGASADVPTLLLCNSLGTDISLWDPQVPRWTRTHHVVRFDQRGHGASDAPPGPYTLERLGRDALAVLEAWELDRVDVCGISLGGMVAMWLAIDAPERVDRLAVADTAARVGDEEGWRARAELVRASGMEAVVPTVLERFFSPGFRALDPATLGRMEQLVREASVEGYAGSCEALAVADLSSQLRAVRAPVVVIVGADDVATTPDDAAALSSALPDARLVVLPDAGHLANLEQPERFAAVVADHLTADHLADHLDADHHVAGAPDTDHLDGAIRTEADTIDAPRDGGAPT